MKRYSFFFFFLKEGYTFSLLYIFFCKREKKEKKQFRIRYVAYPTPKSKLLPSLVWQNGI